MSVVSPLLKAVSNAVSPDQVHALVDVWVGGASCWEAELYNQICQIHLPISPPKIYVLNLLYIVFNNAQNSQQFLYSRCIQLDAWSCEGQSVISLKNISVLRARAGLLEHIQYCCWQYYINNLRTCTTHM